MNIRKFLLFAFFILLGFQSQLYAAFPMKIPAVAQDSASITSTASEENATSVTTSYNQVQKKQSFFQRLFSPGNHEGGGRRYNLRLAVNLCLLGVLGIFGIHRLYLGYTWQGLLQFSGSLAWLVALLIFISTPWWALPAGVGGLILYGSIMAVWQFIDFLRLISNDLRPKQGNYQGGGGGGRRRQYPGRYY